MPITHEEILAIQDRLRKNMIKSTFDTMTSFKFQQVYGKIGVKLTHYVTPYLWILPAISVTFLLIVFKRARLFGPTQKCLISIIFLDVFFTMLVGIRDGILNILGLNYGFVEYKICWPLFLSIRIQPALNATSAWIKSGMLIHQVILFLFPFKLRIWNLKYVFISVILFHLIVTVTYCLSLIPAPIKSVPMIQEFVMGKPIQRIDACTLDHTHPYFHDGFHSVIRTMAIIIQLVYFTALPILLRCIATVILAFCIRNEIKKVALLKGNTGTSSKKVKYLVLMKVNMILSIAFIIQECPVIWSFIRLSSTSNQAEIFDVLSTVHVYSAVIYAIGKPFDVIKRCGEEGI
jgi:hypothetical protein